MPYTDRLVSERRSIAPPPHDELVQFVTVLCLRSMMTKAEAEAIIKQHRHEPDSADPEIIAALKVRYQLPELGEGGGANT